MRLLITDPTNIAVDAADVVSLRAEDTSGSFGILPGHADFLTALDISVVSWRQAYIFGALAMVFIGSAISEANDTEKPAPPKETKT